MTICIQLPPNPEYHATSGPHKLCTYAPQRECRCDCVACEQLREQRRRQMPLPFSAAPTAAPEEGEG